MRSNGNIYHIFKPNISRDIQNLNQNRVSMHMALDEFKYLTSICFNEQYQPPTIDMTKDKYIGRYRSGLISIFVPNSSHF